MDGDDSHCACVSSWKERTAKDLPPEKLVDVFTQGFSLLWRRAHQTLGEVTLMAILDRVLSHATDRYPSLAALKVGTTGLQSQGLRESSPTLQADELAEAMEFAMVEFLTVLGNLTADVLTPSLHALLAPPMADEKFRDDEMSPHKRGALVRKG